MLMGLFFALGGNAQTISNVIIGPSSSICAGASITVTFDYTGFVAGSTVTAQVSDFNGNFPGIGSNTGTLPVATGTTTINIITSGAALPGTGYMVRVIPSAGAANTAPLTLLQPVDVPVFALGNSSSACQGSTVMYTATTVNTSNITYSMTPAIGSTINAANGSVTYGPAFTGSVIITAAAAGCGATQTAPHLVTVTPTILAPVFALGVASTRCQGGNTVTYSASSTNSTGITYSISAAGSSTINPATGSVSYDPAYSGTAIITASAAGCGGPLLTTHTVTITPTVGVPVFTLGASSVRCQGNTPQTYTATASNSTGITYSMSTAGSSTINPATGAVSYDASYSGPVTITATAAGCNGPAITTHSVFVTPTVGMPVFAMGNSSSRCQGAGVVSYTATSTNNTGIIYSLNNPAAGTINPANGDVTFYSTFNGSAIITATAAGCNGPLSATHSISTAPPIGIPVFAPGAVSSRCQGAASLSYAATAANVTATNISYSVSTVPPGSTTSINQSGVVSFDPAFAGIATITAAAAGCNGPTINTFNVTVTPTVGTPVFATGNVSTTCPGTTATYLATSSNNTTLTYSISAAGTSTINSATGGASFSANYSGPVTITATATGCNGPVSNSFPVTVTPNVSAPVFSASNINTRCQGNNPVTYNATAANSTSIAYSLSPATAGTITAVTGGATVNYLGSFSGQAIITAIASGCGPSQSSTYTVTVNTQPVITALPHPDSICSELSLNVPIAPFTNVGSSYTWSKTITSGSASATGPLSGNSITDVLVDSSSATYAQVQYTIIPVSTVGSCIGAPYQFFVKINPKPILSNSPTDSVCSGIGKIINLIASTPGNNTFGWNVSSNIGNVIVPANSGSGTSINQILTDTSNTFAGMVQYTIIPTSASGCTGNPSAINVKVNPRPVLTSSGTWSICSDSLFVYSVTTSTGAGTTYKWLRSGDIGNASSGGDSSVSVTLKDYVTTNHTLIPRTATYTFTLTSPSGCPNLPGQTLTLTIKPTPDTPGIAIYPRTKICSGAIALNFRSSRVPDTSERYIWSSTSGGVYQNPDVHHTEGALISFPVTGVQTVRVISLIPLYQCLSKPSTMNDTVGDGSLSSNPTVVSFNSSLVCLSGASGTIQSYQWGKDSRTDLDSNILTGETAQNYIFPNSNMADTLLNYYWVLAKYNDGCVRKAYYIQPKSLGITPQNNASAIPVKVYPNPAQGLLNIELPADLKNITLELLDFTGRRLLRNDANASGKTSIDVSALAPGYYLINCWKDGSRIATSRFIKN